MMGPERSSLTLAQVVLAFVSELNGLVLAGGRTRGNGRPEETYDCQPADHFAALLAEHTFLGGEVNLDSRVAYRRQSSPTRGDMSKGEW